MVWKTHQHMRTEKNQVRKHKGITSHTAYPRRIIFALAFLKQSAVWLICKREVPRHVVQMCHTLQRKLLCSRIWVEQDQDQDQFGCNTHCMFRYFMQECGCSWWTTGMLQDVLKRTIHYHAGNMNLHHTKLIHILFRFTCNKSISWHDTWYPKIDAKSSWNHVNGCFSCSATASLQRFICNK